MWRADLHLHSPHSKGGSPRVTLSGMKGAAMKKGIDLLGTGDCFHPKWKEAIGDMEVEDESGFLYSWDKEARFVPTVEVSCEAAQKRVHVLMVFADMDAAGVVEKKVAPFSDNIEVEGRPVIKLPVSKLMECVKDCNEDKVLVIPAHCLTPWFGIMGDRNHLLDIRDELTVMPDAFETGLSADKKMVKQLAGMEDVPLVSFSDAHSLHNIGREVTEFSCGFSWEEMVKAIRGNETSTIEFPPALGMYHVSGHRNCNYRQYECDNAWGDIMCPVCKRKLTIGVEQRVKMLKDKDVEMEEQYLIPLIQLINHSLGIEQITRDAMSLYDIIISGNKEIDVLCNIPIVDVRVDSSIKLLIESMRNRHIKIIPGYDGVYGIIVNTYKLMNDAMMAADRLKREGKSYQSEWDRVIAMEKIMVKRDMVMRPGDEQVFH